MNAFFNKNTRILGRGISLILNCDERHLSDGQRFKMFVPDREFALKGCFATLWQF
jgi:hypothetical protein